MPRSDSPESLSSVLNSFARRFGVHLDALFTAGHAGRSNLGEAMRYSLMAGGKRLRPFLAVQCGVICGGTEPDVMPAAVAIECVHTFSLVHDDLPAMDDDDFRRGQPSCHKAYGEGLATLVGDALLALAFERLTAPPTDPVVSATWVRELADAVGWNGMMAGQADDLAAEGGTHTIETVHEIHALKTARLFEAGCRLGALGARADSPRVEAVGRYGHHLGRAFQIADDLLDRTGSAEALGKSVGKDRDAGKLTYPGVVGVEASRAAAAEQGENAVAALAEFGPDADDLRRLARFVVERDH